jgi:hypothetical protein
VFLFFFLQGAVDRTTLSCSLARNKTRLPHKRASHKQKQPKTEFPGSEGAPPPPEPPLPPASAPPGAARPPFGCIASSFAWCEAVQVVDLVGALVRGRGWTAAEAAAWLDAGPTLELTAWVGGRADCPGAQAAAGLVLLDGEEVLPPYGPRIDWAGRGLAAWASGDRTAPTGGWARLVGRVDAPRTGVATEGRGARRALVFLRGRDTAFWAGHYGAKWAAPSLRFLPGGSSAADDAAVAAEVDAALPRAPPPPPPLALVGLGVPGVGGGLRLVGARNEVGLDDR